MIERVGAEDGARDLRAAGADEAGEAEDLAACALRARRRSSIDGVRVRALRAAGQALDLERDLARARASARAPKSAPTSRPTIMRMIAVDIGVGDRAAADVAAVAQHGVAVAERGTPPRAGA